MEQQQKKKTRNGKKRSEIEEDEKNEENVPEKEKNEKERIESSLHLISSHIPPTYLQAMTKNVKETTSPPK